MWIDTCCIDRASDAEISGAIYSTYRWYQGAGACYAFLTDPMTCISEASEQARRMDAMQSRIFEESGWLSRAWDTASSKKAYSP